MLPSNKPPWGLIRGGLFAKMIFRWGLFEGGLFGGGGLFEDLRYAVVWGYFKPVVRATLCP